MLADRRVAAPRFADWPRTWTLAAFVVVAQTVASSTEALASESIKPAEATAAPHVPVVEFSGPETPVAPSPPDIRKHSQQKFAVYQGDRLKMRVELGAPVADISWVRSEAVECRSHDCEFDTSKWGLGIHRVQMIVTSAGVTQRVTFRIRVLTAPPTYRPGQVQPEDVDPSPDTTFKQHGDDLFAVAQQGRGFVLAPQPPRREGDAQGKRGDSKLEAIATEPRPLTGREELRTASGGVVRFGRNGVEQFWMLPNSEVTLREGGGGRREIAVVRGRVRARMLGTRDPAWSLTVDGKLQVDLSSGGDVLVLRPDQQVPESLGGKQVQVIALRGTARIRTFVAGVEGAPPKIEELALATGQAVSLVTSPPSATRLSDAVVEFPQPVIVAAAIERSTPYFLTGEPPPQGVVTGSAVAPSVNWDSAFRSASVALRDGDAVAALELLLPWFDEAKKTAGGCLQVGIAMYGAFLHREASTWFKCALAAEPELAEAKWYLGRIALENRRWERASTWLEAADDDGWDEQQLLHYYAGVSASATDDVIGARSHFTRALWTPDLELLDESAREWLDQLEEGRWFRLRGELGYLFDSNVLRTPDGAAANGTLATLGSGGVTSGFAAGLYGWHSPSARLGAVFELQRVDWLEETFSKLGSIEQEFGLDIAVGLGGHLTGLRQTVVTPGGGRESARALLELGIRPRLGMMFFGERVLDSLITEIYVGSPQLWGLQLASTRSTSSDPLPGRDDLQDPTTLDPSGQTDRSNSRSHLELGLNRIGSRLSHFKVSIAKEDVNWTDPANGSGNVSALGLSLGGVHGSRERNSVALHVDAWQRTMVGAEDGRKDLRLRMDGSWKWHYTPAFSHVLGIARETQNSNREMDFLSNSFYARVAFEL